MKKQANIFAIVSIACAVLGLLLKGIIGLVRQFTTFRFQWSYLDSADIIVSVVIILFFTVIPAIIVTALQIVFAIFALKASVGKKSIVNWIALIAMLIAPIITTLFKPLVSLLICEVLQLDSYIYAVYSASGDMISPILINIASFTLIAANAFAIAEKKLGLPEQFETEE